MAVRIPQRMGRDSNPRCTHAHSSFQDCRLRPLGHPSCVPLLCQLCLLLAKGTERLRMARGGRAGGINRIPVSQIVSGPELTAACRRSAREHLCCEFAVGQFVACAKCSRLLDVPETIQGEKVICPGCKSWIQIPSFAAGSSSASETPALIACPKCRSPLKLVRQLAGMRVRCNTCKTPFVVSVDPWKLTVADPLDRLDEVAAAAGNGSSPSHSSLSLSGDPDVGLSIVTAAWPKLPAPVRIGILAMIRAVISSSRG